jgi:ADP-heptose:LPS heptosyltransferase
MSVQPLIPASRIVVVMPNWLGDGVMATPFLRALRAMYPAAHIAAVAKPLVAPVLAGLGGEASPWVNEVRVYKKGGEAGVAAWLRGGAAGGGGRFELGILLPNSFRSAWMVWRGGVRRRLGFARGGRGWLLTDRLTAAAKTRAQRKKDSAKQFAQHLIAAGEMEGPGELLRVERVGGRLFVRFRLTGRVAPEPPREWTLGVPYPGPGTPLPGGYQPVPTVDYYLRLAGYLAGEGGAGGALADRRMELGVTTEERGEAATALAAMGVAGEGYVVMVPGANYGSSKCWPPERFAEVADRLTAGREGDRRGVDVVLASSPSERPIVDAIVAACRPGGRGGRVAAIAALNGGKGASIGALKEIVRRAGLMICNDTGPRHFAAAFGVPVVTLFGPTDPVWAETYAARERIVRVDVPCGPCQLKKCPIDHRCMRKLTADMVMDTVAGLREGGRRVAAAAPGGAAQAEVGT